MAVTDHARTGLLLREMFGGMFDGMFDGSVRLECSMECSMECPMECSMAVTNNTRRACSSVAFCVKPKKEGTTHAAAGAADASSNASKKHSAHHHKEITQLECVVRSLRLRSVSGSLCGIVDGIDSVRVFVWVLA